MPTHPRDDQFYRFIDVRNPSKPIEVGRWQMPGTKQGDNVAAAAAPSARQGLPRAQLQRLSAAARTAATSPTSTAACTFSTSPTRPTQSASRRWDNSPPYTGFMHTVVPLFDRGLMLVTDEFDREQRQGLAEAGLDSRRARREQSRADLDLSAAGPQGLRRAAAGSARTTSTRTCRCRPAGSPTRSCSAPSSTAACAPTTSPTRTSREAIATFVPPAPHGAPTGTIQLNDVFVDEREIVYTVDRHIGGLYILEMDF